jgi:hypothetical protein
VPQSANSKQAGDRNPAFIREANMDNEIRFIRDPEIPNVLSVFNGTVDVACLSHGEGREELRTNLLANVESALRNIEHNREYLGELLLKEQRGAALTQSDEFLIKQDQKGIAHSRAYLAAVQDTLLRLDTLAWPTDEQINAWTTEHGRC